MSENTLSVRLRPLYLSLVIILADQVTKALVVARIPLRTAALSLGGDFFRLIHVRNTGVAFSLGDQLPETVRSILFSLLPLLILGYLAVYVVRSREESSLQRFCLGGIIGGGLGNLIDRIFRPDGVVDFLDVKFYGLFGLERWPTFNLADSAVVVCGILLFITLWFKEKKEK